jgi:tRNA threonylcarbamoyladenosine biosynthesis protein TsaE
MESKSNTIELRSAEATNKFGAKLAEGIKNGGLLCLYGELGSGKTTLSKGIAKGLGIKSFSIKSPTYTYIRKYDLDNQSFYHVDLYRLTGIDELIINELNEILANPKNIVVIEWADKLDDYLIADRTEVHLKYLDENSREIKVYEQRKD